MSIDGYLDSASPHKLALSNPADFDRVDQLRADSDAILIGASTLRRDDPRLLVRSGERRAVRSEAGLPCSPTKVTVTATGAIPCDAAFFSEGDAEKLVYCPVEVVPRLTPRLKGVATVVGIGSGEVSMAAVLADLDRRGVGRLMVEGGGHIHTQFLVDRLADELQLVVAPVFIGEERAPRFVGTGRFPWNATHRATLAETRQIGDVVLLRYALSERFARESDVSACARRPLARS
jgi:5-amino-6-(5-phosphoribosylamino)uracil reductase